MGGGGLEGGEKSAEVFTSARGTLVRGSRRCVGVEGSSHRYQVRLSFPFLLFSRFTASVSCVALPTASSAGAASTQLLTDPVSLITHLSARVFRLDVCVCPPVRPSLCVKVCMRYFEQ